MRFLTVSTLVVALAQLQSHSSFAMEPMKMGGSMKMAKCPASDPAVIVNTTKMHYELDTKANRDAMKGMMGHDKFVCKSEADKMGAKMKKMTSASMKTKMKKM